MSRKVASRVALVLGVIVALLFSAGIVVLIQEVRCVSYRNSIEAVLEEAPLDTAEVKELQRLIGQVEKNRCAAAVPGLLRLYNIDLYSDQGDIISVSGSVHRAVVSIGGRALPPVADALDDGRPLPLERIAALVGESGSAGIVALPALLRRLEDLSVGRRNMLMYIGRDTLPHPDDVLIINLPGGYSAGFDLKYSIASDVHGLLQIAARISQVGPRALDDLKWAVSEEIGHVRAAALVSIGIMGTMDSDLPDLVTQAMDSDDQLVRIAAVFCCGGIGMRNEEMVKKLAMLIRNAGDPAIVLQAIVAAIELHSVLREPEVAEALVTCLNTSNNSAVREIASYALRTSGWSR